MSSGLDFQNCQNCHFSDTARDCRGDAVIVDDPVVADDGTTSTTICRRSPPTLRIIVHNAEVIVQSFYPPTRAEGWCGEWKRLTAKRVPEESATS